jgi:hypothetical protein
MLATTERQCLGRDREKKLPAKAGIATTGYRTKSPTRYNTIRRCHLQLGHHQTYQFNLTQRQGLGHRQPNRAHSTTCRQLTVTTSDICKSDTVLSKSVFERHNIDLRSYSIKSAGPCEYLVLCCSNKSVFQQGDTDWLLRAAEMER